MSHGYTKGADCLALQSIRQIYSFLLNGAYKKLGAQGAMDAVLIGNKMGILGDHSNIRGGNGWADLTESEAVVLHYASLGLTVIDTANIAGVSFSAVQEQRRSLVRKLQARSLVHAVTIGLTTNLLPISGSLTITYTAEKSKPVPWNFRRSVLARAAGKKSVAAVMQQQNVATDEIAITAATGINHLSEAKPIETTPPAKSQSFDMRAEPIPELPVIRDIYKLEERIRDYINQGGEKPVYETPAERSCQTSL